MKDKPHKRLKVWEKSVVLVEKVYRMSSILPRSEEFGLTNQMRRSAVSIASNIAEGAARQTRKEFIHFLHIAQGSLSELDTQIEILKRLGYLNKNTTIDFSLRMEEIDKMLTGLIQFLRKKD
jgi:four helix bundle protein